MKVKTNASARVNRRAELRAQRERADKARRRQRWISMVVAVAAVIGIGYGLWTAVPTSGSTTRLAPDFTLSTTAGGTTRLSALRGKPVLIYFNEGAGCGSCFVQMAEIEKNPGFAQAGITVLPVVMNTAQELRPDLSRYKVATPYLLDDGKVAAEYGVLGKGMHQGLPGHSFVLIDAAGVQRWYGEYPSMWLAPADLLKEVTTRLA